MEIFFAYYSSPGAIDNNRAIFHFGNSVGVDKPFRFICERGMYCNKIGLFQEFVESDKIYSNLLSSFRRYERVIDDNVHF